MQKKNQNQNPPHALLRPSSSTTDNKPLAIIAADHRPPITRTFLPASCTSLLLDIGPWGVGSAGVLWGALPHYAPGRPGVRRLRSVPGVRPEGMQSRRKNTHMQERARVMTRAEPRHIHTPARGERRRQQGARGFQPAARCAQPVASRAHVNAALPQRQPPGAATARTPQNKSSDRQSRCRQAR